MGPTRYSHFLVAIAITFALGANVFFFGLPSLYENQQAPWPSPDELDIDSQTPHPPVACYGPRGKLLNQSRDDQLLPQNLAQDYPEPLGGAYDLLGLEKSWLTADGRYGPYGHGQEGSGRTQVDWNSVDWAKLQDDCLKRNELRFRNTKNISEHVTLSLHHGLQNLKLSATTHAPRSPRYAAGRTAIVLRSYSGYKYKKEDLINIRSMIVEAALASGGQYAVYLLVDMKDHSPSIFESAHNYNTALNATLPPELRSIAVLWDEALVREWYPKVGAYAPLMQMPQALQLFAQVYDGFDYYWQWEMDARLTGNTLNYFESLSSFAKSSPRKQSFERASFRYLPTVHGPYSSLLTAINASVNGEGTFHPVAIPEVPHPIGPSPPVANALDDDFTWGVGEEADFIGTVPCKPLPETSSWLFKDWVSGFAHGPDTPRIFCPQACSRISWNLLNIVHTAQITHGQRLASESTMPSFALWHGLKLSQPPQPWFMTPPHGSTTEIDKILNGGPPSAEHKGFALGTSSFDGRVLDDFNWQTQQNWWWRSNMPEKVMRVWLGIDPLPKEGENFPFPLVLEDGKVYAPNMALHPFKTNHL